MTIAIFGATGQLGGLTIDALLERGTDPERILALGRNAGRLETLASRGLRTAVIDLDEPDTLDGVLQGSTSALLISTGEPGRRLPQHRAAVDAAASAGVEYLVYTSALQAPTTALVLAAEHKATEEYISDSGIPASFLRNGWYTENHAQDFAMARERGVIANSVGEGRIASATRRDFAEAAAVVIASPSHAGTAYELSGDHAWDYAEFAETAQRVLGTPVRYEALTGHDEHDRLIAAGVDEQTASFVVALNANMADGAMAHTSGDLARLIGRATEPLEDTLRSWL